MFYGMDGGRVILEGEGVVDSLVYDRREMTLLKHRQRGTNGGLSNPSPTVILIICK